jgi:adenosylcobyric acid synthase
VTAPAIMVQGTASSVGKSLIAAALCRLFSRRGLRVAPFKAQNMALNSYVTPDGAEIGRAQAVQALAARTIPRVEMNPVLLKPEGNSSSQVVVLGKPIGSMKAAEYQAYKPQLRTVIADCLARLRGEFDVVVIEGAGSPAEINLKQGDIVNMDVARRANVPVILVGDIDRGGVFASFVGTMELLEPDERKLVAAFLINKFRGDPGLLTSGLEFLLQRTGVPVMGVVPYVPDLRIPDEDSVSLDSRARRRARRPGALDIAVLRLPRISNYDDVEALEHEAETVVRFVGAPEEAGEADLVIVPGSKCTVSDLAWLRERGLAHLLLERARAGRPVLGICGGCQMLGLRIEDPLAVESPEAAAEGLGLLPLLTRFGREKRTAQVRAEVLSPSFLGAPGFAGVPLSGYEIHMGMVEAVGEAAAPFRVVERNGAPASGGDGAIGWGGAVVGTMLHGLLENAAVRAHLLRWLRDRAGLAHPVAPPVPSTDAEIDRLTTVFAASVDQPMLWNLIHSWPGRRS